MPGSKSYPILNVSVDSRKREMFLFLDEFSRARIVFVMRSL